MSPLELPENTNWLDAGHQRTWFNKCSQPVSGAKRGLNLEAFGGFLEAALCSPLSRLGHAGRQHAKETAAEFSYEQQRRLFELFDEDQDQTLDEEEFGALCARWLAKVFRRRTSALVIVDVQNDFVDGSLALINGPARQDGLDVVPVINGLLDGRLFQAVAYTQDWHPADHIGFHENLHLRRHTAKRAPGGAADQATAHADELPPNGRAEADGCNRRSRKLAADVKVFDVVVFEEGKMEQKLWPTHCVQGSWGAELQPQLRVLDSAIRVRKGTLSHVDAYSAFWDNMRLNETGLRGELAGRSVEQVFVCGLALDYCVAATALDSAKAGFVTFVVEDACRGIDTADIEARKAEMRQHGVVITSAQAVHCYLAENGRLAPQEHSCDSQHEGSDECVSMRTLSQLFIDAYFAMACQTDQAN